MAQLPQAFNPMGIDPTQSAGQMPIGKHLVVIEKDEVKATNDNSGGYLQFDLKIVDGPNAGGSGAYRLNLYNSSPKAVEIAQKQLAAICHVTGQFQLGANGCDTSVLWNIPFYVEVGPQKEKPEYTEIKKVFDRTGNEPGKQAGAAQGQQQQPQSNPVGGFGSNAPQGQGQAWNNQGQQQQPAWGGQQQQQPQQQPQNNGGNAGGWQQQQPQGQQQQQPAWGAPR